jgi:hypothetical protein
MAEDFGGRSFGAIHILEKKQNGEVLSEKAQNVDEKVAALRMDIIGNQSMVVRTTSPNYLHKSQSNFSILIGWSIRESTMCVC